MKLITDESIKYILAILLLGFILWSNDINNWWSIIPILILIG